LGFFGVLGVGPRGGCEEGGQYVFLLGVGEFCWSIEGVLVNGVTYLPKNNRYW
jgi:hypothetical protein